LNDYFEQTLDGDKVVIDSATNLMWQQAGSPEPMPYDSTERYIRELNNKAFAGFKNWRLPTLGEAMPLMEPQQEKMRSL
jgi:serine/threonine-protein kinase